MLLVRSSTKLVSNPHTMAQIYKHLYLSLIITIVALHLHHLTKPLEIIGGELLTILFYRSSGPYMQAPETL